MSAMPGPPPESRVPLVRGPGWVPWARFDDLRVGRSMVFTEPSGTPRIVVADRPGEVVPVLRAVEEATAAGRWAVGFVSYEAAGGLDPTLTARPAAPGEACGELPLAWFCLFAAPRSVETLRPGSGTERAYTVAPWQPDGDRAGYDRTLASVRAHIAAGDTYQCNLTVRLRSRVSGDVLGLYRDLALAQRGAHNVYLDTGRFVVASASPELFFDWSGDRLTTRPMKGTIARGRWPAEDAARAAALAGSGKDRAENLMIVDLLRSDLGRLAEVGSVDVPAMFEVERYETLWQLTSTVTARPRPGTSLVEVFQALFPCGSVTGAPKRNTMALIAELEESRRGVYCGAVGIVAPPGSPFRARFNVAIRTVVVDRSTGDAVFGTGGGVTWDSTASSEHAELMAKAAILDPPREEFALVETMGFWPEEGLRNREHHLGRLAGSAAYFGFPLDPGRVRSALGEALADVSAPCRVRLVVPRSGIPAVEVTAMPSPQRRAVVLAVDPEPVDSSDVWLYHKTTRRSTYKVRAARHPGADDVILVNERGEVTETTVANLAVRIDGRWWTPPVDAGCLPGVERIRLIQHGQLTERPLTLDELHAASGIALVSSLRGWRPGTLRPASCRVDGGLEVDAAPCAELRAPRD
jgi:para-aminobenzoate synthetase/4-amino-4-deoxychorismate lyase